MTERELHQADIEMLKVERDEARKAAREMLSRMLLLSRYVDEPRLLAEWVERYPWLGKEGSDG